MTSYLNNDYDIMNCSGKFEKFLPHSITILSFMTVESEMPELDWGYKNKLGSQDLPYKLGLSIFKIKSQIDRFAVWRAKQLKNTFEKELEILV